MMTMTGGVYTALRYTPAMPTLTVYLKPTCTTCRKSVDLLTRKEVPFETVDIFKTPLTAPQIRDLCRKLGVGPRQILRANDPAYQEHDLGSGRHSDDELYALMAANPGLIQRPIVVQGDEAVVARPIEAMEKLLR